MFDPPLIGNACSEEEEVFLSDPPSEDEDDIRTEDVSSAPVSAWALPIHQMLCLQTKYSLPFFFFSRRITSTEQKTVMLIMKTLGKWAAAVYLLRDTHHLQMA